MDLIPDSRARSQRHSGEPAGDDTMAGTRARLVLAAAICLALAGCASPADPPPPSPTALVPVVGEGISASTYDSDESTWDIRMEGVVVDLGQGCLGIRSTGTDSNTYILAVPRGSRIVDGKVVIDGAKPFGVNSRLEFTGSAAEAVNNWREVKLADGCPTTHKVWFLHKELAVLR